MQNAVREAVMSMTNIKHLPLGRSDVIELCSQLFSQSVEVLLCSLKLCGDKVVELETRGAQ
jgi:hypothetical protein